MNFFNALYKYLPDFGHGLWLTILLTLIAAALGFLASIPLVLGVLYGNRFFKLLSKAFITLVRGTPLLVQLFFIYYGLPALGTALRSDAFYNFILRIYSIFGYRPLAYQLIQIFKTNPHFLDFRISPFTAALIGFILNSAAYQAEYLKGGFLAITTEQMEAAYSIGLTKWQAVREIIFPQAFRFSIPALSNEIIYLVKYTSVAYIIQVPELLAQAKFFASDTFYHLQIYLLIGAVYLGLIWIVSKLTDKLEKKLFIPGFDISHLK